MIVVKGWWLVDHGKKGIMVECIEVLKGTDKVLLVEQIGVLEVVRVVGRQIVGLMEGLWCGFVVVRIIEEF